MGTGGLFVSNRPPVFYVILFLREYGRKIPD